MKRVEDVERPKEDVKKKQNPFAVEELLEKEKKRIREIISKPRKIADPEPNDPKGLKQKRKQYTLDLNATNNKIEEIFSTFVPHDPIVFDENGQQRPPQVFVTSSYTSAPGVWNMIQSSAQDPFWLEVVTALNYPDVKAIRRVETPEGRILRVSTFTADDIRRIGVGDGLLRELINRYEFQTSLQYGTSDEQASLNIMKGIFINFLLGFNEASSLNFLSLFVTYLVIFNRCPSVVTMIQSHAHSNEGWQDDNINMVTDHILYEEENSFIYLTQLDLFRKDVITRYRFYQSNLGDNNNNTNNNDNNNNNNNNNIYAPLNITLDNGVPTSIACQGNIKNIVKFYHDDKLLIYVIDSAKVDNNFLLKIHCDDFTNIERVDKVFIGPLLSDFNDVNFLDATSLYDAKYCSTLKAVNLIEDLKLLDLTLLGSATNFIPLEKNESRALKKYQMEFHPDRNLGFLTGRDETDRVILEKDHSKEGIEKYNRYTEYIKLRDKDKTDISTRFFQSIDPFLKVGSLDTGYYDGPAKPTGDRKRILAAKIVSLPSYRKQIDFFTLAIIGIDASNTLFLYITKFKINDDGVGYEADGNAFEKELNVIDLPGENVSYSISDFKFYFYTNEVFYIELEIKENNPDFNLLEFDVSTSFRSTTDMTSKFIFGVNREIPMPGNIPNLPFFEKIKPHNYKVLKYGGGYKTTNLTNYDHIFYRNNGTLNGCRFIFMKLFSAIPSIYIIDVNDINMNDITTITPFIDRLDGGYAYITLTTKNQTNPVRIIKILKGTGYKEYDNDIKFLDSAFKKVNLGVGVGGQTKLKCKCSLCGKYTTKFDELASNYYCDSMCQYLFIKTRRMNII